MRRAEEKDRSGALTRQRRAALTRLLTKRRGKQAGASRPSRDLEAEVRQLDEKVKLTQQAEDHYRIFTELISDFAYVAGMDANGTYQIEWMSEAGSQIFGYAPDRIMTAAQVLGIIYPEDRPVVIDRLARVSQGEAVADEIRFVKPDGTIFWMSVTARPIFDPQSGLVVKLYGAGQDITERKQKELALVQNQGRFHTLFDESPVALWEEDYSAVKSYLDRLRQAGVKDIRAYFEQHLEEAQAVISLSKVINVNRAALKLRGLTNKEELIEFKNTVVRFDPNRVLMRLDALAQGLTDFEMEGPSPTKNGGLRHTVWHYSVIPGYEHTFGRMIVSILDVTASRNIENALRQEARRFELLNSITNISLALGDLKTSVKILAERMRSYAGADACFISGWDGELQQPVVLGGTGDTEERVTRHMVQPGESSITRAVIDAGLALIVRAEDASVINQRVDQLFGRKSALALPLRIGEQKVGAVVLLFDELPPLSKEDLELWNQVADQVSLAIASLKLYDQSQQRTNELEKLVQISSDLRQAQTYNKVMDLLVREMVKIVGGERCALIIKRGKKWMLVSEQSYKLGTKMGRYELSDEMIQGMLGSAQKYVGNFPPPGGYTGKSPWLRGPGSFTFVPLRTSDAIVGVAAVGWREGPEISPENRRLLTTIAEIAENALQRANLLETLEQRVRDRTRDLQILYDLSALSNRQVSMKRVMQSAIKRLVDVVNGKAGLVFQVKGEDSTMNFVPEFAIPPEIINKVGNVPVVARHFENLYKAHEPVFLSNIRDLPETPPGLFEQGMNAGLWFPLIVAGKLWGVIVLLGDAVSMNTTEKNLVMAVSDLLGTIIENHDLQKSFRAAAVMEERQRLARGLHDSVTQSLYGLTLLAEAGREYALAGSREPTLHYLERTSETAHRALREMRMLLYELRPPELEKLGLAGALRYRLEAVEQRVGLEAHITTRQTAPISGEYQEALFWIAQEALNNTLKHANASKVSLNLRVGARRVILEIADNGQGFEQKGEGGGGMGLVGMRERAERIGAQLHIESAPGKGTRVTVELLGLAKKEKSEHE